MVSRVRHKDPCPSGYGCVCLNRELHPCHVWHRRDQHVSLWRAHIPATALPRRECHVHIPSHHEADADTKALMGRDQRGHNPHQLRSPGTSSPASLGIKSRGGHRERNKNETKGLCSFLGKTGVASGLGAVGQGSPPTGKQNREGKTG